MQANEHIILHLYTLRWCEASQSTLLETRLHLRLHQTDQTSVGKNPKNKLNYLPQTKIIGVSEFSKQLVCIGIVL